MNLLEIFTGTRAEKQAKNTSHELQEKLAQRGRLSTRDQASLETAEKMTRRAFLRRAGASVVVAAVAVPSIGLVLSEVLKKEPDTDFEDVYQGYIRGFENVARGNPEAEKYLAFFKERRKKGKVEPNGAVIALEAGKPDNFYTAIVDPRKHPRQFAELPGSFAFFNTRTVPHHFTIKNIPVDRQWSGALLAKESVHVYQWLNNIEQTRPNGYIDGEIDAYNLEMDILESLSGGRFKAELATMGTNEVFVQEGAVTMRGSLTPDEFARVDGLFPPFQSEDEKGLRAGAYLVGVNFALIERNARSYADELNGKRTFINFVQNGAFSEIPQTQQAA